MAIPRYRQATIADIDQLQTIRNSVKENILSNPALVTAKDYADYLSTRGAGWLCELDNEIIGFAIVDMLEHNVWALFLKPGFEGRGLGKRLHNIMIGWYFSQTKEDIWLGTEPGTRAETFYRSQGWQHVGMHGNEYKFIMSYENWLKRGIK